MSANFSCYGESAIATPNVDRLAKEGVMFTNAVVTAPVCSTCRSAFITGMYQTTIGAHHHRSGRGSLKIHLPTNAKLVPKLFQEAGYYTTISGWPIHPKKLGKTDYNFQWDKSVYDGNDWSGRDPGQPFFAQIQTPGGKLRGKDASGWNRIAAKAESVFGNSTGVDQVRLPPYYPSHPDLTKDWAAYLDSVKLTDAMVGEVLERLEREELLGNTIVLFMTDHGISHARGKQFLYEEGIHVPLVIRGPGITAGSVRDDVVEHIDIAGLSLGAAGIPIPESMQARNILDSIYQHRKYAFSARDRCDETVDHIRSVRTKDFKYIRNFLPERPYLQPCAYKDAKSILIAIREWDRLGKLNATQKLVTRSKRPREELYELNNDPYEINNLADRPAYAEKLVELRGALDQWMKETQDLGQQPESEPAYDSDMALYLKTKRKKFGPEGAAILEANIRQMKQWAREGK